MLQQPLVWGMRIDQGLTQTTDPLLLQIRPQLVCRQKQRDEEQNCLNFIHYLLSVTASPPISSQSHNHIKDPLGMFLFVEETRRVCVYDDLAS